MSVAGRHGEPRYPHRWECDCSDPPVLLARHEPGGITEIKVRDRLYWIDGGTVRARCPKCGNVRTLQSGVE